jgi:serine/threonine-protein kinase
MNAERYRQVKRIFLAACGLEPESAAAFLDQACAGDAELRREVASLLEHHSPTTIIGKSPDAAAEPPARLSVPPNGAASDPGGGPRPERFPPGSVLSGRYRMIAPLGRGGMGDVYRADDLKLDQPVALKFLSQSRSQSAAWVRRYQNEVRLARKVTHPNVVRVYDISEAEGEVFISMEYVDGEDLAALLHRIGRLSGDKAIQVARQLCAGLGAAHDQGVLHRDLKPANIMIDGRGQVRIADFGIAAPASVGEEPSALAGTPAFMAPELFSGGKPSIRSDLYGLGIVLYEAVTGEPPFAAARHDMGSRDAAPVRPAAIVPEIDAGLERVVLQCLERDPRRRPESAYAVAAALPGGDALALALAAGEMPSPSMVAAASSRGALSPLAAICCVGLALAALCLVVRLAARTFFLPQTGLVKSPAALADRAEQILTALGHEAISPEHWQGFAIDRGFLQYAAEAGDRHRIWASLPNARPPAVCFWYRAGGDPFALPALLGQPAAMQAFPNEAGTATVRLDGRGRLLQYLMTPDRAALPPAAPAAVDWPALFELAGLPMGEFQPMRPVRQPPVYADALAAWQGACPESPEVPIRVEGASLGDRVVFFEVIPPWDQAWTDADEGPSRLPSRAPAVRLVLYLLVIVGGSFLAWHNARLGRGDLRGANKLLMFILLLGLFDWLLGERHVAGFTQEISLFYSWMARATLTAAIAWLAYFAVEPYLRRFWPQIMITWSRLLCGKFRDPAVGRDILIGSMCGILLVLLVQLDTLLPFWLGRPPALPRLPLVLHDLGAMLGLRYKLSLVITAVMTSVTLVLALSLFMLVLRGLLRRPWLAMAAAWLALTALETVATGPDTCFPWLTGSLAVAAALLLLVRLGVVALMASLFVWFVLMTSPITSDLRAWYAPAGTFAVLLAIALVGYGFLTARTGRPILWQRWLGD